jgi:hypothetical protein
MVKIGSLVSSLPDRPLPLATVEELEEHGEVAVSEPIHVDDSVDGTLVTRFALVTTTVGVVLDYVPGEGWTVTEKVTGEGQSPKEMVLALSVESIKSGMDSESPEDPR